MNSLCVLPVIHPGFCLVDTVIPESGSIIVGRENQEDITIFCDLLLNGSTQATVWHIADEGEPVEDGIQININTPNFIIGGDPIAPGTKLTFNTNLTIVSLTADLDGRVIFCGRSGLLDAAQFSLRVYSKLIACAATVTLMSTHSHVFLLCRASQSSG